MMRLTVTSEMQIISAERVQRIQVRAVHRFRDRVKFIPGKNGDYSLQRLFICRITVIGANNPII